MYNIPRFAKNMLLLKILHSKVLTFESGDIVSKRPCNLALLLPEIGFKLFIAGNFGAEYFDSMPATQLNFFEMASKAAIDSFSTLL